MRYLSSYRPIYAYACEIDLGIQTDLGNHISFPSLTFGGGFKFNLWIFCL